MTSLILAIALLGILVFVHELGHFAVAKISGMRVEKFSIGMGPVIASIKRGDTEYVFGAVPAGGYVSVTGAAMEFEEEFDLEPDDPRRYPNRPILHRALFAAAGPMMNIILAVILLVIVFMSVGISQPKDKLDTVVSSVTELGPADKAGVKAGDRIIAVDGIKVTDWETLIKTTEEADNNVLKLTIQRENESMTIPVKPVYDKNESRYLIGVTKEMEFVQQKLPFKDAFSASLVTTKRMSTLILDAVGNLVTGKTAINDKEKGLSGPVGIVKAIDDSAAHGIWHVLMLMAVLSINLGLLNLLPVPALDGSKLLFLLLEAVRGRPVSPEREGLVNFIGFACLMFLMIYVTFNDIIQLI